MLDTQNQVEPFQLSTELLLALIVEFILVAVPSVAGVGWHITRKTITVTDFDVIVPFFEKADDAGKIISLQNSFVSSINLLDSNYIVRKQITGNVTGTSFSFNINDLGDNDLILEPFTENNYILTWQTGEKELLEVLR